DRSPADITEDFVTAAGTVDGLDIKTRELLLQHWHAKNPVNGHKKIFIFSPGYKEDKSAFYPEISAFSNAGHDAFVMDHQWMGLSDGKPGKVDRGFGVARDVAAVVAHVDAWAKTQYEDYEIVLVGNSMGAGAGIVGAVGLNDANRIQLTGGVMPKAVPMIL